MQQDGTVLQLATVGDRDVTEPGKPNTAGKPTSKVDSFITDLMKKDRVFYERLVDLMRYFNLIDVDLRLITQLKNAFLTKGKTPEDRISLLNFKEAVKIIFKHFR